MQRTVHMIAYAPDYMDEEVALFRFYDDGKPKRPYTLMGIKVKTPANAFDLIISGPRGVTAAFRTNQKFAKEAFGNLWPKQGYLLKETTEEYFERKKAALPVFARATPKQEPEPPPPEIVGTATDH